MYVGYLLMFFDALAILSSVLDIVLQGGYHQQDNPMADGLDITTEQPFSRPQVLLG